MLIHHPNPTPGEVSANGLTFIDGIATVTTDLADVRPILEAHGFRIEASPPTAPATKLIRRLFGRAKGS